MKVQTQTITSYIANDGKSFDTFEECKAYENSIIPLWKQIGVADDLVSYHSDDNEVTSRYCEGVDITEELENYTNSIIQEVYRNLCINNSLTLNEVKMKLGLTTQGSSKYECTDYERTVY